MLMSENSFSIDDFDHRVVPFTPMCEVKRDEYVFGCCDKWHMPFTILIFRNVQDNKTRACHSLLSRLVYSYISYNSQGSP